LELSEWLRRNILRYFYRGPEVWNQWREDNPEIKPGISGTDLNRADLRETDFRVRGLGGVCLAEADLRGAYLGQAILKDANLYGAHPFDAIFFQGKPQQFKTGRRREFLLPAQPEIILLTDAEI
jgi:hypothetical protein